LTIKDRWGYNPLDVAHKVGFRSALVKRGLEMGSCQAGFSDGSALVKRGLEMGSC